MNIDILVYSPFQVNTYIISDQTNECIIIDPACYTEKECLHLQNFLTKKSLKPVLLLNTHTHLDHIFGNNFVCKTYNLKSKIGIDGKEIFDRAPVVAQNYGLNMQAQDEPGEYISEKNTLEFGNSALRIFDLPGHCPGSLVFYNIKEKFAIVGDVIFDGSIGRTDLPGGNFDTLISGIKNKIYTMPDDLVLYPGHGKKTTVKKEKLTNPFTR